LTIHDISLTISPSLTTWPSHPKIDISRVRDMAQGARSNVSRLELSSHTGTHVDAPLHFIAGGRGVETLDLSVLVGPALVVDARAKSLLDAAALDSLGIPPGAVRLLLRTHNSDIWAEPATAFHEDYVALDTSGAEWVLEHGIRLVGVDYLSVAAYHDLVVPHQKLLGAGVIPLEGLNLSEITPGEYQLVCLPLKIGGGDGAPCRAVLIR
jgi:arylformamidase